MKLTRNIAVALSALAFGAVPAVAVASGHGKSGTAPGKNKTTTTTTSTTTTTPGKSNAAYGRICAAEGASKKHVAGSKGTAFSQCVTGLAHAAKHPKESASSACAGASKKHVSGSKGTPFSECVAGVAKLRGNS